MKWPVVVFAGVDADDTCVEDLKRKGVDVVRLTNRNILPVLEELGRRTLQSVLVEGGGAVAGAFIDSGLVNKVTFFIAPKVVGGVSAPGAIGGVGIEKMSDAVNLERVTVKRRGDDIEVTGYCRAATE
jgi:diaminohydroxyphosphoribosylaminopyrimidine deaminase / 5-amino-6-(5-phosphoribosylamino)uracil reductase